MTYAVMPFDKNGIDKIMAIITLKKTTFYLEKNKSSMAKIFIIVIINILQVLRYCTLVEFDSKNMLV